MLSKKEEAEKKPGGNSFPFINGKVLYAYPAFNPAVNAPYEICNRTRIKINILNPLDMLNCSELDFLLNLRY